MTDAVVRKGMVVFITFSVMDEQGQVMGQQDMPTGYVHGAQSGLFEEIEAALEGVSEGQQVEVWLSPDKAFGQRDESLVIEDDLDNVPPMYRLIGAEAQLQNEAGDMLNFRVTQIAEGRVTLDANHPLAGRNARCVATVLSIRPATPAELRSGFPAEQGMPSLQ